MYRSAFTEQGKKKGTSKKKTTYWYYMRCNQQAKHEAEKLRKYRIPVANAGAIFKPFVMGADGTLGLQAAEIMMVMLAKNLAKECWKLRDQLHLSGPYCWIYNRLSFVIIRASSNCMRGYRRADFAPMVY
jgi:hypothetical protein